MAGNPIFKLSMFSVDSYRFNFGSGEGLVTLDSVALDDGEWHEVSVERHGNGAKVVVDRNLEAQGSAPGINDVLNLENSEIFYGSQVVAGDDAQDIQKGGSTN
jgi:protocadherin Fat 1/2/3